MISKVITFAVLAVAIFATAVLSQFSIPDASILDWEPPEAISKKYPYYLSGFDQDGAPVWICEYGRWDVKAAVDAGGKTEEDLDKYVQQMFRRWVESARNLPGDPGFFVLADLEAYDLAQSGSFKAVQKYLWFVRTFVATIKEGTFKGAYVINANYLFQTVWNLSKPLFGQVLDDFELYGTNTDAWKIKLLKAMDKSQLPEWYGGSKDHKPVKVYG